jgi:hypothetical protein
LHLIIHSGRLAVGIVSYIVVGLVVYTACVAFFIRLMGLLRDRDGVVLRREGAGHIPQHNDIF